MRLIRNTDSSVFVGIRAVRSMAAILILLVMVAPAAWAQNDDAKPDQLAQRRTSLYVEATHVALADLQNDINRIAVLSETCRIKYGTAACGLADKPLDSDKIEDRFGYYVKQPVETHAKGHGVKIDRNNWAAPAAPAPAR